MELSAKELPANAGDLREVGSMPWSERSLGGGYGNPLQYSCLKNPIDKEIWWTAVHGVTNSWTQLSDLARKHASLRASNFLLE